MGKPTNVHDGHRLRLKEQYAAGGSQYMQDHQLLELLLFYCIPQKDTNALAHELLAKYGSLSRILTSDVGELVSNRGVGLHSAVLLSLTGALANRMESDKTRGMPLHNSQTAMRFCIPIAASDSRERAYVISLDKERVPVYAERIGEGSATSVSMHPREVIGSAIRHNASRIILVHNHPSGDLCPSEEDIQLTHTLITALLSIDVPVVDHIIVGRNDAYSMRSNSCLHSAHPWQITLEDRLPAFVSRLDVNARFRETEEWD
ncbi:MAG: DNA repair protein RadC [Clostridia bacterium]|nr:DNA repair protein RadC [Clostridia bacterium]